MITRKIKRDYGVIILNYNTAEEAILAAESVIEYDNDKTYVICIADNKSTNAKDFDILHNYNHTKVEVVFLPKNEGYARGNNQAIKILTEKYDIDYVVIMNPDVLILKKGTIDGLIDKLNSLPKEYSLISPLTTNGETDDNPQKKIIGSIVPSSYFQMLVMNTLLFKYLFLHLYNKAVYKDIMPFKKDFDIESVQGAFFICKSSDFKEINYFDNRTFLYGEERILGYKLRKLGRKELVAVDYIVQHEGGKSTKIRSKIPTARSVSLHLFPDILFIREYLKCPLIACVFYKALVWTDFGIKTIIYSIMSALKK